MNPRRHIIVEGPDGSGKDGLIARLRPLFPNYQLHVRASTSTGGPVPYLTGWVQSDLTRDMRWRGPWIYNRYPLISEPIYAPIARKTEPQGAFADKSWVKEQSDIVAEMCFVVWCMPPMSVVCHNVRSGDVPHMPGVADTIELIYGAYADSRGDWVGPSCTWDYTVPDLPKLHHSITMGMSVADAI